MTRRVSYLLRRFKAWIYDLTHPRCKNYDLGEVCECADCQEACGDNGHEYDADNGYMCLNCNKEGMEDMISRACDYYEGER